MSNIEFKPTCVGTLQKSHPKSCFRTVKIGSIGNGCFNNNPSVLQVMAMGDWMVLEYLP